MPLNAISPKQRRIEGMDLNCLESKRRRIATTPHRLIPPDITRDILSRLRMRSLARFRHVCKLWRSIIHDPDFTKIHVYRTRNPSIIFAPNRNAEDVLHIVRLDADMPLSSSVIKPYFSKAAKAPFGVTGSCNGLVCIVEVNGERVQVLNPLTGESLTPPMHTKSYPSHVYPPAVYLGYHPVTKEYKLVNFFADRDLENAGDLWVGCEVYTVGAKSWRKIPTRVDYHPGNGRVLVSANGSMFWNIKRKTDEVSLLRFDLKEEEFSLIPTPKLEHIYEEDHYKIDGPLVDLQGSICAPVLSCSMTGLIHMELWLLNNDGHSWTHKYTVTHPCGYPFICYPDLWIPLFLPTPLLIHDDKILLQVVKLSVTSVEMTACFLNMPELKSKSCAEMKDGRSVAEFFL